MEIESVTIKSEDLVDDYCHIVEEELHIKEEHPKATNENPYKCGICGHRTTTDTLLKVHMKMHLVRRLHQCNVCKKTFSFVSELNSHILSHIEVSTEEFYNKTSKDHNLQQFIEENSATKVSVNVETVLPKRELKNNPHLPLNNEEKVMLLEFVETLKLNKKYQKLEQIKSYLRNGWLKMVEMFAEKGYGRNAEKLARTYFHLKNQAKTRIEKFYKHKKLPRPHDLDYMFVKLCPNDFDIPGIDMQQVIEDSKRFGVDGTFENKSECFSVSSDDDTNDDSPLTLSNGDINEKDLSLLVCRLNETSEPSASKKRNLPDQDGPPPKISKTKDDSLTTEFNELRLKLLLEEEERKKQLYDLELRQKEQLFEMDKKHREKIYRKELEIKNLELVLLKQKVASINSVVRV